MTQLQIPGSPSGLDALAQQLQQAANDVTSVSDRVATNGLDGDWSGAASDAFRTTLHRLPGELNTVGDAFGEAVHTIQSFSNILLDLQGQARWYDAKIAEAEEELTAAEERHSNALTTLRVATAAHAAASDPATAAVARRAVETSQTNVAQAGGDVDEISGTLSGLRSSAAAIEAAYADAVGACCGALDSARGPSASLMSRLMGDVEHMYGDAIVGLGVAMHEIEKGLDEDGRLIEEGARNGLKEFDHYWEGARRIIVDASTFLSDTAIVAGVLGAVAIVGGVLTLQPEVVAGGLALEEYAVDASTAAGVGYGVATDGDIIAEGTAQTAAEKKEYTAEQTEGDALDFALAFLPGGPRLANWEAGNLATRALHGVQDVQDGRPFFGQPLVMPQVFRFSFQSAGTAFA